MSLKPVLSDFTKALWGFLPTGLWAELALRLLFIAFPLPWSAFFRSSLTDSPGGAPDSLPVLTLSLSPPVGLPKLDVLARIIL